MSASCQFLMPPTLQTGRWLCFLLWEELSTETSLQLPLLSELANGLCPCQVPLVMSTWSPHLPFWNEYITPLCSTGEQATQLPLNGVLGSSRSSLTTSEKPAEEWPDWSEPEETENEKTVNIQIQPQKPQGSMGPYFVERDVDEKPWDDFEPSSPHTDLTSGNCLTVTQADAAEMQRTLPGTHQQSKELESLKVSPSTKSSPGNSWNNDKWDHRGQLGKTVLPKQTLEERLKSSLESGLGEEFTIKVKRKPVQDPELDWFADMTPDIKPSSAVLILPEARTEAVVPSHSGAVSSREGASQNALFSSKFAAVDVIEVRVYRQRGSNECTFERILKHIHCTLYCCGSSRLPSQIADSLRKYQQHMAVQLSLCLWIQDTDFWMMHLIRHEVIPWATTAARQPC